MPDGWTRGHRMHNGWTSHRGTGNRGAEGARIAASRLQNWRFAPSVNPALVKVWLQLSCCLCGMLSRLTLRTPVGNALLSYDPLLERVARHKVGVRSMASNTTDLCDAHEEKLENGELRVCAPVFSSYGRPPSFKGPIATVKVFEDNVLVRKALSEEGRGKVLLVDGGGSLRCALLGGNLATMAQDNGWAGIIVNGCVRDVDEINACEIGVRALASHPVKSKKKGQGETNVAVFVAGVRIAPGDWCYADNDGVIVSNVEL